MAAALDSGVRPGADDARTMDLRALPAGHIASILEEEIGVWRSSLSWDFRASAGLVQQFQDLRALNGSALIVGGRTAGYAYFVNEDRKGLIGDLYVAKAASTPANHALLLTAVLDQILQTKTIRRVESQLMMLEAPRLAALPQRRYVHVFPRLFLELDLRRTSPLTRGAAADKFTIGHWSELRHEEAAGLLAGAYRDHIDSDINDQYRTQAGALRFLSNIVNYPGCGSFFRPASFLAFSTATTRLTGMCLTSLVSSDVGHITQICVAPEASGQGLGYELMRRSLDALAAAGCKLATLTVTTANSRAVRLYERIGFTRRKEFAAHVWEGF